MTEAPTREELERMLKQCDDRPQGNVWNWKVADLIRHYLALMDELTRIHQAVVDYDHEELRKAIENDA